MLGEHTDSEKLADIVEEQAEAIAENFEDEEDLSDTLGDVIAALDEKENLKPNYDDIVEEAAEYFAGNVGDIVDADPVVRNVTPNHGIEDLDELLQYHFLRTGEDVEATTRAAAEDISEQAAATETDLGTAVGVRDFVTLLENRLRTVDADVTREVVQTDGEVIGRIDWQETLKHRHGTAAPTDQTYACRVQRRGTVSARNRVLFDLLGGLLEICQQFERRHVEDDGSFPDWLDGWGSEGVFRKRVSSGLSNAHFREVDTDDVTASRREIKTVRSDREPVYREAAALLDRLREIEREGAEAEDAEDLFGMDVFVPDEDEDDGGETTVYELYWIFETIEQFRVVDGIETFDIDTTEEDDGDLVAAWEDDETDSRYLLFNDWNGTAAVEGGEEVEYLRFGPPDLEEAEGPDSSTPRAGYTHQAWRRLRGEGLDKSFRTDLGTPDIVLLELDATAERPMIRKLFVGEVKHTNSLHTVDEGIAQLAEYGAFAEVGAGAVLAGEPEADYVATNPNFLEDDRLELGLFMSSGNHVEGSVPDEIQLCWFDDPIDADGSVDPPLRD